MPIRINLLAEAQALEEMRRKDPVKRAIYISVVLVLLMLVWSSSLQLKSMLVKGKLSELETQIDLRSKEFQSVLDSQKQLRDAEHRLLSLQKLTTNRLVYGTMLDALQKTTIDDVQLVRVRAEQTYAMVAATKAKTNGTKITPAKPAKVTERIMLTFDAKDTSAIPGDAVNKYRNSLAASPYFQEHMGSTNEVRLSNLSPPQSVEGKTAVLFSLECRYPEVTR